MSQLARTKIAPFSLRDAFWCAVGLALVRAGVLEGPAWRFLARRLA